MIRHHSPIAHAAYVDLLGSLRDDAVTDIRGTPTRVTRGNRVYWYDTFRVGNTVQKTYIGEDNDALRGRLARRAELKATEANRQAHRARLIRVLRAEGFFRMDGGMGSLIAAFAKAGTFRVGGTLVGTIAFRLYEGELGLRYSFDDTAQTNDIDIASFERLSLAIEDCVAEPLQKVLADFTFDAVPSLDKGQCWRWRQTRSNTLVEFLTPSFDAEEGLRPLQAPGVHAQSLHYLNYLIAEPVLAALPYRSGVLVQIPRPERFAIHKLIISERRSEGTESLKARKDRHQAAFLISALAEDRPDDLKEALVDAMARGPRWRMRIDAALARLPETARQIEALGAR